MAANARELGAFANVTDMIFIDKAKIAGFFVRGLFKPHHEIDLVFFGRGPLLTSRSPFFSNSNVVFCPAASAITDTSCSAAAIGVKPNLHRSRDDTSDQEEQH